MSAYWYRVARYKGRTRYLCEWCKVEITGADEYYARNYGSAVNVRRRCITCGSVAIDAERADSTAIAARESPFNGRGMPSRVTIGDRRRRKIELR